jgi:hypothetical protein
MLMRIETLYERRRVALLVVCLAGMAMALASCGDRGEPLNGTNAATGPAVSPTGVIHTLSVDATAVAQDGWSTFTTEGDGFSVDMPGEPSASTQQMDSALGELTSHFFQVVEDGGRLYVVSYNDYPAEMASEDLNPETVLNEAVEATAQGSEVENVQRIEVQGNPGIEGEINVQGATHIWYRGILVENRLYQLVVGAPQTEKGEFSDEARRFIDSFTLLSP